MNRFLVPLVILLASLLYSWFWNQSRKPHCIGGATGEVASLSAAQAAQEIALPEDSLEVQLTPTEKLLFEPLDVYFQSGSPTLLRTAQMNDWLALAKQYLEENPSEKLLLTGHADSEGSTELNQRLSEERATKVREILVAEGFPISALEVTGKGELEPIAENTTEEGRQKNRRVSIRLIK